MIEGFVDDTLLADGTGMPTLLGSRCPLCSAVTFPHQQSCPRCAQAEMKPHPLARTGTLWTFTVQRFRPKPPYDGTEPFSPYYVGYVNLHDEVLVEARLIVAADSQPCIGQEMELVIAPYGHREDGSPKTTFAFRASGRDASR